MAYCHVVTKLAHVTSRYKELAGCKEAMGDEG